MCFWVRLNFLPYISDPYKRYSLWLPIPNDDWLGATVGISGRKDNNAATVNWTRPERAPKQTKMESRLRRLQSSQSLLLFRPPRYDCLKVKVIKAKGKDHRDRFKNRTENQSHAWEEELWIQFDFSRLTARHAHHCGKIVHHELSLSLWSSVCLWIIGCHTPW